MTCDRAWAVRALVMVGSLVSMPLVGRTVPSVAPDLTPLTERMEASIVIRTEFIDGNSLALDECLAAVGVRTLIRFETAAFNAGTAAIVVGRKQSQLPWAAYQVVDAQGTVVAVGHKQSVCVRDDVEVTAGAPSPGYDCQNQGLSPGWADVYSNNLDCQYVDITDVAPGNYLLRIELNPARRITESNSRNNVATFPVVVE